MNTIKHAPKFVAMSLALWATLIVGAAYGADKAPPMKPLATCNDGSKMSSATGEHRGACSGHGGVASWADGSPVKSKAGRTTKYTK